MNLHNQIMNIPVPSDFDYEDFPNKVYAYKSGHRDARHAAAELALKADAYIEILEKTVRDAIGSMLGGNLTKESDMSTEIFKAMRKKVGIE